MIYITGDTHGDADSKKLVSRTVTDLLKSEDYLIIAGDFGFVWDYKKETHKEKTWLDWFEGRPWTTLFVDGNHECFPRLNAYPEKMWNGGKVHEIRPSLFHLMRGQCFEIDGKKIFTLGGASSHDRGPHIDGNTKAVGKYWWPEELPSEAELAEAQKTVEANNGTFDYIVTHCLPSSLQEQVTGGTFNDDRLTDYLDTLRKTVNYSHWYTGHYHIDRDLSENVSVLFKKVIPIGTTIRESKPVPGFPMYKREMEITFMHNDRKTFGVIMNVMPFGSGSKHDEPEYMLRVTDRDAGISTAKIKESEVVSILHGGKYEQ